MVEMIIVQRYEFLQNIKISCKIWSDIPEKYSCRKNLNMLVEKDLNICYVGNGLEKCVIEWRNIAGFYVLTYVLRL